MGAAVGEVAQRRHVGPHAQVDDHPLVLVGPHRGQVAVVALEAPDKPGAAIGQPVHHRQAGHEVGDVRVVQRGTQGRDVELGELGCRRSAT